MDAAPSIGFEGLRMRCSDISGDLAALNGPPARVHAVVSSNDDAAEATAQSDGSWKRFGWIAAAVGGIALVIWYADNSSSPAPPIPTSQAPEVVSDAASDVTSTEPMIAPAALVEAQPPIGADQVLNASQIAYCLAEDLRMTAAQPKVDTAVHTQVAAFNLSVADFNSRCGAYRYVASDRTTAQEYVDQRRDEILAEGAARFPGSEPQSIPPVEPAGPQDAVKETPPT